MRQQCLFQGSLRQGWATTQQECSQKFKDGDTSSVGYSQLDCLWASQYNKDIATLVLVQWKVIKMLLGQQHMACERAMRRADFFDSQGKRRLRRHLIVLNYPITTCRKSCDRLFSELDEDGTSRNHSITNCILKCWHTRVSPVELIRAVIHAGVNDTTGFFQPQDDDSREFLSSFLKFLIEWHRENGARILLKMQNAQYRDNGSKLQHKRV